MVKGRLVRGIGRQHAQQAHPTTTADFPFHGDGHENPGSKQSFAGATVIIPGRDELMGFCQFDEGAKTDKLEGKRPRV